MVGDSDALPERASTRLRVVFVDAAVHYVDERGEHSGLLSESVSTVEDRTRLGVVSNNDAWLRTAIELGDELLGHARRVGQEDAWGCTSGWYGGANPGPNRAARIIKTLTGRKPPPPDGDPMTRPSEGRWSVRQVFRYDRGTDLPTVAIWHLGFSENPQFWPNWCDAISAGPEPALLIVPDSPITRAMVQEWNDGKLRAGRRTWTGDGIRMFSGEAAYVRPRISTYVDAGGAVVSGQDLTAAMTFLRARHQLRVSPFDLLRDPLMRSQLQHEPPADPSWTARETAVLSKLRAKYERVQKIHSWIEAARENPPTGIFATGDSYEGSVEACLRAARRAVEFGQLADALISSWTGWAPSALERGQKPVVPAKKGTEGQLVDWYRQTFALAAARGLLEPDWYPKREKWHSNAQATFPGPPDQYYEPIRRAEAALASERQQATLVAGTEFPDWHRAVFADAVELGIIEAPATAGTR